MNKIDQFINGETGMITAKQLKNKLASASDDIEFKYEKGIDKVSLQPTILIIMALKALN
jgi:hypothetical protein